MNEISRAKSPGGISSLLELLYTVTDELNSSLDLIETLKSVLSQTVQAMSADRGCLILLDANGRVSDQILVRDELEPEPVERMVSVVMDKGLAGWVFRNRKSALIDDIRTDDRWYQFADDFPRVRSVLSVPLLHRQRIDGIITLTHSEPGRFNDNHRQLLTAMAQQAAMALENERLSTQIGSERDVVASVLDGITDAILVSNGNGFSLLRLNPAACLLFGVQQEDVIGKPLHVLKPPAGLVELFDRVSENEPQEGEVEFWDGRHFYANLQQIPRVGRVVALHDITHFKELDAIKSEFVASVSHDLKNPLGTILGYVWLLGEEPDLLPDQRDYVESIHDSVMQMQRLVVNLLDLAKIEAGIDTERELCSIESIFSEVNDQFARRARSKPINLVIVPAVDLAPIMVNRIRMVQAIGNLIGNAIKFTPVDGTVTLKAIQQNSKTVISVKDTGQGISMADQARLFHKFSRVGNARSREAAGTGLGLAIVRSVVESHGGIVWVESQPGEGSTFFIELPVL